MKTKNIVIRSGSLQMGGLERVLIEVLQNLDLSRYQVSLIIEYDCELENIFQKDVPKEIELYFLKPKSMIDKTAYYRKHRKNLMNRLIYNFLLYKEHRFVERKTKDVLKKITQKHKNIDVFIDYDWGARRYVDRLNLKKKIVWIHNSVPLMLKKQSKIRRFGKNLRKYDTVVTICDEMKKELIEIYPYLKNKVTRIYNPFNFNRILEKSNDESELNEIEKNLIKKDYIVAVSRLDTVQKDYLTLLKGYKFAKEKGIKEKLYIVGDGCGRNEIEKYIKDFHLDDEVILLGQKINPYIWMKNSKLFIHSSKYEGFGLVLVEVGCLKKAIICSECKVGPKEILDDGKFGKLFPIGDYKQLGKDIVEILQNKKLISEYERKIFERVKDFDAKKVLKEYERLIDE